MATIVINPDDEPSPEEKEAAEDRRKKRVAKGEAWRKRRRIKLWRERVMERRQETAEAQKSQERAAEEEADKKREQEEEAERKREQKEAEYKAAVERRNVAGQVAGGAVGRRVGAALGSFAGPLGTVAGAAVGGLVGRMAGGRLANRFPPAADGDGGSAGSAGGGGSGDGGGRAPAGGATRNPPVTKGRAQALGAWGNQDLGDAALKASPAGFAARMALDETEKAFKFVGRAAQMTGDALTKVAGNDGVGLFKQGTELAADALEKIPVVGKAAAAGLKMVGDTVGAVNQVMGAFAERGRQLSGFNGQIAAAEARQGVTRMQADIREAQQLGDKYAALLDKQTQFEEAMKAILLPIKEFVLDKLTGFIDFMIEGLAKLVEIGYALPGVKDDKVREIAADIRAIRRRGDAEPVPDPFDPLARAAAVALARGFGLGVAPPAPAGAPLPAPLGVPLLAPPPRL